MVKSLLIHLGGHKTGSTSIQGVLARQGWSSPEKSLFYPAVTGRGDAAKTRGNHAALAVTLFRGGAVDRRDQRFARVAARLAASDADIGVLSAERFEYVRPELMQEVLARHFPEHAESARFIAYVRPHAERLVSAYSERVKHGVFSGSLAAFHGRVAPDGEGGGSFLYHRQFLPWKQCFGARFHLRPMIRDRLKDGDVVADFLDFALDGAPFSLTENPLRNPSLSLQDLVMIAEFHRIAGGAGATEPADGGRPDAARNSAGVRLARHLAAIAATDQTPIAMDRALAERVVADWSADAAALDRAFFDDRPMTGALEAAPGKALDQAQSVAPEDHFGPGALRLIRAWSGLLGEVLAESATRASRREARLKTAAAVNARLPGKGGAKGGGKSKGGKGSAGKSGAK